MKISFVFPPMWPPISDGSLSIWNREVTTRLSPYADVLVYAGSFDSPAVPADAVAYNYLSTWLDNRVMERVRSFDRVLGTKRVLFATDVWYPAYALRVALDVRKRHPDVVHVYNYPQFAHLMRRLNPEIKLVLNMHGEWLTQVAFTDLRARLREVDLITSCSDFITASTSSKFPDIADRCRTVPMGVSPGAFQDARDISDRGKSPPRRLLYVGRISPEKGVHVLLEAFELISRQYPDASLTIVGPEWIAPREHIVDLCLDKSVTSNLAAYYEGSYLAQLKQRLSAHAAERVTFAGLVPHSEIASYYAAADICVCPSLYESFGMSVIEAMAAGVPVVATRVGAVPQLISDQHTGLIVNTADPKAIASAIARLFGNAQLWSSISRSARKQVSEQYSWDTICTRLLELYSGLLCSDSRRVS